MKWEIDQVHDGFLIRDYLITVRSMSRRMLKAIKTDGLIKLNNHLVTVRETLRTGDVLEILFPEEQKGRELYPKSIPLHIVYEDEDVLVLNKQAGLPVIPSRLLNKESIAHGLLYYYEQQGLPYTVHVVTRLDRNTSGLMLVAKHRFSHSLLSNFQREGEVKRKYTAFIEGRLDQKEGTIEEPIGRKPESIIERMVRPDGKEAITHYGVIQELQDFSVVQVQLQTGRTHQIRVHFSYLGHPLVGDDLYGGSTHKLNRQALHCHELAFYHPFQEKWMTFSSELPPDMQELI
ncbi:RluA family pseudouridine synthase [Salirhabdus sp. Marseille-P4669]|uniref:RluA family pseudouridine synthase n=1 Tax=Salirhabdus sp. Marseille-P4669 TaxID=2042310 RepID=UPI000C7C2D94|nr:RluA family pseudouridine synthase [Salirhabdus sp. Marseille-P4669]